MATTQFAFCSINADIDGAIFNQGATVESKTPTTSTSATTAAARADQKVCRVSTDTLVYVSFGAAPNAGTDTIRFLVPANTVALFRVSTGDKAAVISLT